MSAELWRLQALAPAIARGWVASGSVGPLRRGGQPFGRAALVEAALAAAEDALVAPDPEAAIRRALRGLKYRVVAALVLDDDDGGPEAVDPVTAVLSDLADALLEGAMRFSRARLEQRHGSPEGWGQGGVAVLALGKHGAGELNYSSDIDVVFVAGDLEGECDGPRRLPTRTFADRLVAAVAGHLAEPTGDGFCFRVDLDLRPEGRTAPPICTVAAAEEHFLLWGRTWERAAWLRARPAAGDLPLGDQLLHRIGPFLWRRHMDFHTLDEIAAMRDRIAVAARGEGVERDLKKGQGGIREVEFLLQATQLVRGGREPALRVRGTVQAARLLNERGALPPGVAVDQLLEDWRLLRAVEHRLQWPEEQQTQLLPAADDAPGWAALAGRCRWAEGPSVLQDQIAACRSRIAAAWAALRVGPGRPPELRSSPAREAPTERNHAARAWLDPFLPDAERCDALRAIGFPDPAAAAAVLRQAEQGGGPRLSPQGQRRFERVLPTLLCLAAAEEEPLFVLEQVLAFVRGAGGRGTVWALLEENPRATETLVRLFGASPLLGATFVRHPEQLDALVLRGRGGDLPPRGEEALVAAFIEEGKGREGEEEALAALRTGQCVELLRIGLSDLGRSLPRAPGDREGEEPLPHPWLCALARACVRQAADLAQDILVRRHGVLLDAAGRPVPVAVIGLGSLGSGWLTYGSDLDLVVVVGDGACASAGPRIVDPVTWAARWGQRLISVLSVQTSEGRCYEVDLRLRPEGPAGPVAASLSELHEHLGTRAAPWERIAYTRARVIAATDAGFARQVDLVLDGFRAGGPALGVTVCAEAIEMRARQVAALGADPSPVTRIKRSPGGLADLEFEVAVRQLACEPGHPAAAAADPQEAVEQLVASGAVDAAWGAAWRRAFRACRRFEGSARLRGRPWAKGREELEGALAMGRELLK